MSRKPSPAFLSIGLVVLLVAAWQRPAQAQVSFSKCELLVTQHQVWAQAEACNNTGHTVRILVFPFSDDNGPAGPGTDLGSLPTTQCATVGPQLVSFNVPNGKYKAFCVAVDASQPNQVDGQTGPKEWVVGPDLIVYTCSANKDGATVKYHAWVCNIGTDVAKNFRVGFYYTYPHAPPDGSYSDHFESIEELRPSPYAPNFWWNACKEVKHERHNTPNGEYISWVKVDSGNFVLEALENNNVCGPKYVHMANPDLVVRAFDAEVAKNKPYKITYHVKVCNEGAATARIFWIDVYYDRDINDPPEQGQPGEIHERIRNLAVGRCVERWYDRVPPEEKMYQSWVQADSDKFVTDPDRSNNLKGPLEIHVPGGVLPAGCLDNDKDGFGVGASCDGRPDCDDNNQAIHPGAAEICGDDLDNDCDGNIDNGCPGVDCNDLDGDGSPSGADCQQPDCDDADPERSPLLQETCGDGKDNDCDGIVDDCCPGSTCCDSDNDGYGVGTDCPGPQDCNDDNPQAGESSDEVCGDGKDNDCDGIVDDCCPGVLCCDSDNDGYGVGVGCEGPQDPDDNDPNIPAPVEICGNGLDDDGNGIPDDGCRETCTDNDGDGYCVGDGDCSQSHPGCVNKPKDCDDTNKDVHPGAQDSCDNVIDDNCDGTVNNGPADHLCPNPQCVESCAQANCVSKCAVPDEACLYTCGQKNTTCASACGTVDCVDHDNDGWGSGPDCSWSDCDDGDNSIYPGQEETCNGKDDNCNGTVDDHSADQPACPNPDCVKNCGSESCRQGCGTDEACLYECGTTDQTCVSQCPKVECEDKDGDGWGTGPDCAEQDPDDTDPSVHPGARDICGDGIDQDGDGVADDGCLLCVDLDHDGYGVGSHCLLRDCNDMDDSIHPHAPETCGDKDKNCDGKTVASDKCPSTCNTSSRLPALWWIALLMAGLWFMRRKRRSPNK